MDIINNTYLTSTAGDATRQRLGSSTEGVLAKHRADIAQYLRPAAAVAAAESSAVQERAESDELRASLQTLRGSLVASLKSRREALKVAEWYQAWHQRAKSAGLAASAGQRDPSDVEVAALADATGTPSDISVAAGELEDENRRQAALLLAAIDASLLGLRLDVLGRHAGFPYHFATMVPGTGPLPAAKWMHAVLK